MQNYKDFNINQIMPVLMELKQAKIVVEEIIQLLKNYNDFLSKIIDIVTLSKDITDEIKSDIDKNVLFVMNSIDSTIKKQNPIKKTGSKKETIFERFHRGITYKYKIKNNIISENPEHMKLGDFLVFPNHRNIQINNDDYQFLDSTEYFMDDGISCYEFPMKTNNTDISFNKTNAIKKIKLDIDKIFTIIMIVDIYLIKINTYISTIIDDIKIFDLFDIEHTD
jgi:hypothetical protein